MMKDHHDQDWIWKQLVANMDGSGKIVWAKHNKMKIGNVKAVVANFVVLYLDIDTWSILNKCKCSYTKIQVEFFLKFFYMV